jgi:hypothetical protein
MKLSKEAIVLWAKYFCGLLSIANGSTCEFSRRHFDVHDYHKDKGGDGYPSHFYTYKCPKCGKEFEI